MCNRLCVRVCVPLKQGYFLQHPMSELHWAEYDKATETVKGWRGTSAAIEGIEFTGELTDVSIPNRNAKMTLEVRVAAPNLPAKDGYDYCVTCGGVADCALTGLPQRGSRLGHSGYVYRWPLGLLKHNHENARRTRATLILTRHAQALMVARTRSCATARPVVTLPMRGRRRLHSFGRSTKQTAARFRRRRMEICGWRAMWMAEIGACTCVVVCERERESLCMYVCV